MKFDANRCAGLGGGVGIIVGLLYSAVKYNFPTQIDYAQQALGGILAFFIIGAVIGWFAGKVTEKKK